jgi:hypothetical protein
VRVPAGALGPVARGPSEAGAGGEGLALVGSLVVLNGVSWDSVEVSVSARTDRMNSWGATKAVTGHFSFTSEGTKSYHSPSPRGASYGLV